MTKELSDDILAIEEIIFNDHIDGLTYEQLAEKHGYSKRQITNLVAKARETIYNRLMDTGKKYFAEIWARYDFVYRQAKNEWETSRNPLFLKEIRATLEAQRKMLGLDAAPKASVNEVGDVVPNMVIIMNPTAYEQKEKELNQIVDGSVKVLEG